MYFSSFSGFMMVDANTKLVPFFNYPKQNYLSVSLTNIITQSFRVNFNGTGKKNQC